MDLGSTQSVDDEYRITLHGSGPGLVMGVDGLVLDGEFSGALPSGDGTEGGDFVTTFTVQGLQPTLQSIQTGIFGPTCSVSGCHSGPTGTTLPTGVDLRTADSSFAALVNVASVQVPSLDRVIPGDPDNSYLIQKLEGTASVGTRMPQGGPFLDPATLAVIRSWIETGALR
jgi:hypothetical protein